MASRDDVKLIGTWASPFVMRSRIALNIKSVDYEFLEEQYDSKSELLLKSNPVHKKIPVLIHGGKPICESLIIVQYIDEVWSSSGPSILPSDPYDRAIARFWAAYIDDKWAPTMNVLATAQGEGAKATAMQSLNEILALLEGAFVDCSKGKNFFGGERIGLVDIAFGCYLGLLRITEMTCKVKLLDNVKTTNLVKWAEKFCADVSVKNVMPQTEKLLEFSAAMMAKLNAPQN